MNIRRSAVTSRGSYAGSISSYAEDMNVNSKIDWQLSQLFSSSATTSGTEGDCQESFLTTVLVCYRHCALVHLVSYILVPNANPAICPRMTCML